MEKKMETTRSFRVYLEGNGELVSRLIMDKKMEATILFGGLGFRVMGT